MVRIESVFADTALEFVARPGNVTDLLEHPERLSPASQTLAAYLAQLEEEGYASRGQNCLSVAWEDLYRLLDHPDHASSLPLLALPPPCEFLPALSSQGALDDANFGIFLDGWHPPVGRRKTRGTSPLLLSEIPPIKAACKLGLSSETTVSFRGERLTAQGR